MHLGSYAWVLLCGVWLGACIPLAAAEEPSLLVDPEGDVEYDQFHLGTRDHAYLDVKDLLLSQDASTDIFSLTLRVLDASRLDPHPADYYIEYKVWANALIGDQPMGVIEFYAYRSVEANGPNPWVHSVGLYEKDTYQSATRGSGRPVNASFNVTFAEPGLIVFSAGLSDMRFVAEAAEGFNVLAQEIYTPLGIGDPIRNQDTASSRSGYVWGSPDEEPPPERKPGPLASSTSAAPKAERSPGPDAASLLLAASAALGVASARRVRGP